MRTYAPMDAMSEYAGPFIEDLPCSASCRLRLHVYIMYSQMLTFSGACEF